MGKFDLTLYAIIQGVSELFPISSSGHLILFTKLTGQKDPGLFMDVAVHVGSLCALLLFFWRDVLRLFKGFFHFLTGKKSPDRHFFFLLVLATIPVVVIGLVVDIYGRSVFRSLLSLGWATFFFGALLYIADAWGGLRNKMKDITGIQAFFGWGLSQCLALIHGASRSGVTITFGRFAGYDRTDATRFSFIMAMPTLFAAAALKGFQFYQKGDWSLLPSAGRSALISFIAGFVFLWVLMWWVKRYSFQIFAIYRMCLGVLILYGVYMWGWR